jgi:hypothetical protein
VSKLSTQWKICIDKLKKEKFFVLENFLDSETCDIIAKKVEDLMVEVDEVNQDTEKKLNQNNRLMVINQKVKGAGKTSKWMDDQKKTLVNIRGNKVGDVGFKDIFNPNKLIEEVEELRKNHLLGKIASEYGRDPNRIQCNIYHSEGITDTRGWHKDTKMIKLFVYLTDVLSEDYGPYCYTNKDGKKIKFLNKKGTLIGTFQDVRHRGWPQSEGYKRSVFVYKIYLGKDRDY